MSRARFLAALFFILAGLMVGAASGARAQTPDTSSSLTKGADFRAGVEKETFFLVNQYRKANDMLPLVWDETIAKVARAHSKDMATGEVDFGHDGFRERVNKLRTVMTGYAGAGENVLMTSELDGVAKSAVALWLKSPHHLENIRGDYNYSGLGVWQDKDGVIYFTQIFMKFAPQMEETESAPAVETGVETPFGMLGAANIRARP